MKIDVTLSAGVAQEYYGPGTFFRLLDSVGAVDIIFYLAGKEVERIENVTEGFAIRFQMRPEGGGFDKVRLQSASTQAVQFVTTFNADVFFDAPPTGNVAVTNVSGAFTQSQKTVTNASAQLLAANIARRYLLIQNNDATGDIYVTLDGTAATTAKGIKIAAGGSLELQGYVTTGQIFAIGSIASNANIVAVEG